MSESVWEAFRSNLLTPPVLFFVLGVVASIARSDLKFPEAMYVALTIYLLCAIGFKGGAAMAEADPARVWLPTLAAVLLGLAIPLWAYPVLRFWGKLPAVDAAAIAGHYGSVSAVTFIAGTQFLREMGVAYEAYAAAFLAAMEAPAIIVGVGLGKWASPNEQGGSTIPLADVVREAVFGRSVVLLVGALIIGFLCGRRGLEATAAFFVEPFQGILALFLLELGTVAGRRIGDLRQVGPFLVGFGVMMPVVNAAVGVWLGKWVGLSLGGTVLLAVLAASASYIAAPAAMRLALPAARSTLYLTAALVITFPFNVTLGIPLYYAMARWAWGGN